MEPNPFYVQLQVDGVWTTYPTYAMDGYRVKVGPDTENGVAPSVIECALANDDLSLDPERAESPLYGKIGRNTPIRARQGGWIMTYAETSSWVPIETIDHVPGAQQGKAQVNVTAEGPLRRLQRWTDPIDSAMVTQILSYGSDLLGYWPIEDPAGALQISQRAPRGTAATYGGQITLAGVDGPAGSSPIAQLGLTGSITGGFARSSATAGYQISWVVQLDDVPADATYLPLIYWRDSQGKSWWINANNSAFQIECVDKFGATLISHAVGNGGTVLTTPTRFRVKITLHTSPADGDSDVELGWYSQDSPILFGTTTELPDHPGTPTSFTVKGNAHLDGGGVGHVFATTDLTRDLVSGYDAVQAFNAYNRETAGARWLRLLEQAGFTCYLNGSAADTPPMGRQTPGRLLDLLQECVATAAGIMYDTQADLAISMRTYGNLINQTPEIELEYGVHLVPPLRRATDDQGVINDVTIENADGSRARAEQATGILSVLPPPSGVGRYQGGTDIPVNYADPWRITNRAIYELRKGTLSRPRYPKITINVGANPELRDLVPLLRPGDVVSVAGVEPDPVLVRILSIEQTGGAVEDIVTLNCLPAEPYMVAVADSGDRVGSSSTTVAAAATSSSTSLAIATPYWHERWSTSAGAHDIVVAGERMTVTAVTAAAWSSGAWRQTMTVTRSVNGVVKAQPAGGSVQIYDVKRVGLA